MLRPLVRFASTVQSTLFAWARRAGCPVRCDGDSIFGVTPHRLYVVEDETKLTAFLDVYQQGRLIVSQSGFALITSKRRDSSGSP